MDGERIVPVERLASIGGGLSLLATHLGPKRRQGFRRMAVGSWQSLTLCKLQSVE